MPSSIADPQVEVNVQLCDPEWLPPVRETARVPPVGLQQLVSRAMLVPVIVAVVFYTLRPAIRPVPATKLAAVKLASSPSSW